MSKEMNPFKINELVAEKVLGFEVRDGERIQDGKRFGVPPYSTNIEHAWTVVEKLENDFSSVDIHIGKGFTNVLVTKHFPNGYLTDVYQGYEESTPLAICKAALKAVGVNIVHE